MLETTDISDELSVNTGKSLTRFDQTVNNFDHAKAYRPHRCNLSQATQHSATVEMLGDTSDALYLAWTFNIYTN